MSLVASDFIGEVAGEAFGALASRVTRARAVRRFRKISVVDCAVRAVDGDVLTLTSEWVYGDATVGAGHLSFQRRGGGEVVGPLTVLRLDGSEMRLSPLRAHHVVVRVVADLGVLEWDVLAEVVDEAASRLDLH